MDKDPGDWRVMVFRDLYQILADFGIEERDVSATSIDGLLVIYVDEERLVLVKSIVANMNLPIGVRSEVRPFAVRTQ